MVVCVPSLPAGTGQQPPEYCPPRWRTASRSSRTGSRRRFSTEDSWAFTSSGRSSLMLSRHIFLYNRRVNMIEVSVTVAMAAILSFIPSKTCIWLYRKEKTEASAKSSFFLLASLFLHTDPLKLKTNLVPAALQGIAPSAGWNLRYVTSMVIKNKLGYKWKRMI